MHQVLNALTPLELNYERAATQNSLYGMYLINEAEPVRQTFTRNYWSDH